MYKLTLVRIVHSLIFLIQITHGLNYEDDQYEYEVEKSHSHKYKEFDSNSKPWSTDRQNKEEGVEEGLQQEKPKLFLEHLLNNKNVTGAGLEYLLAQKVKQNKVGTCSLKNIEMSLKIAECGRVLFNTTSCSGYCKSSSYYIANTDLVKTTCAACKITEFKRASYKVKCVDGSFKNFHLKAVSRCSCFKVHDKIDQLT